MRDWSLVSIPSTRRGKRDKKNYVCIVHDSNQFTTVKAYVKECCSLVVDMVNKTASSVYNAFHNITKAHRNFSKKSLKNIEKYIVNVFPNFSF